MRKIFSVAAGLAGVALAVAVTVPASAVVGGEAATDGGPNVSLNVDGSTCSGTLIDTQWVLTATVCFDRSTTGRIWIWWGNPSAERGTEVAFSKVAREDGLALLQLDQELPADLVKFPSLADADPAVGARVQFFGTGLTSGTQFFPELKYGFANVVTPSENGRADGFSGPSWTTLSDGNGISGTGDWGGGAYLDGKLVGVSATKNGEDGTNFASVAAHRTWIDRTLSGIGENDSSS